MRKWLVGAVVVIVLLVLLFAVPPNAGGRRARYVDAAAFGAIPNDGKDDTAAFKAAWAQWHRVRVAPGWYDVTIDLLPPGDGPYANFYVIVGGTPAPIFRFMPAADTSTEWYLAPEGHHFYHCLLITSPWRVESPLTGTTDQASIDGAFLRVGD